MRTDERVFPRMLQLPRDHIRQIPVFKTLRVRVLLLFADLLRKNTRLYIQMNE
jgi:hypothetical protein